MDELQYSGNFFPHHPVCNQFTQIHLSGQNQEDKCSKDYKRSGRIGAGVLLFWCLEHRECIGFNILRSAESCQSVYEVLSSRFPQMPRYVIYDNACNLFEVPDTILTLVCLQPQSKSIQAHYYRLRRRPLQKPQKLWSHIRLPQIPSHAWQIFSHT
jgi:hypothetical protein